MKQMIKLILFIQVVAVVTLTSSLALAQSKKKPHPGPGFPPVMQPQPQPQAPPVSIANLVNYRISNVISSSMNYCQSGIALSANALTPICQNLIQNPNGIGAAKVKIGDTLTSVYVGEEYDAIQLSHRTGFADNSNGQLGWTVTTATPQPDFLVFGPYTTSWGENNLQASFTIQVDNNSADNLPIATIDIFDSTANQVIAKQTIYRRDCAAPFLSKDFILRFNTFGRANHAMETRVFWHGYSWTKVVKTKVLLM